ncbi:hypothetical protein ACVWXO_005816 [Bradyrhizobium sp. LM2.7]
MTMELRLLSGIAPRRMHVRHRHDLRERTRSFLVADSDDLARVYRFDLAQDSEVISPTVPI